MGPAPGGVNSYKTPEMQNRRLAKKNDTAYTSRKTGSTGSNTQWLNNTNDRNKCISNIYLQDYPLKSAIKSEFAEQNKYFAQPTDISRFHYDSNLLGHRSKAAQKETQGGVAGKSSSGDYDQKNK